MSEGGEARNHEEVEAVARMWWTCESPATGVPWQMVRERTKNAYRARAGEVIAALDRVRSSGSAAQNHEGCPHDDDDCAMGTCGICGPDGVYGKRGGNRSPQSEDHEAGIPEAALDAATQAVHASRHYALGHPSRRALWVDARDEAFDVLTAALPYLPRASSPVSGTEPDTARRARP